MKNVLFLVYYFPPLGGSGVQRPLKFAKYLREFGWNPVVICPEPGVYPYYDESLLVDLEYSKIEVHRVKGKTPFHLKSLNNRKIHIPEKITETGRKLLRLLLFPDNKKGWIKPAVEKAEELSEKIKFDLIFSTAPPFSNHMAAAELKKILKIPMILDYRDLWTGNHFMDQDFSWQKRIHKRLENLCLKEADRVVTLDKEMSRKIRDDHSTLNLHFEEIPHGYDPHDFDGTEDSTLRYKANKLNFLYSGLFYESNQPDIFLKAVSELIQESKISINDVHFHFQGGLTSRILKLMKKHELDNSVTNYGYMPHDKAVANIQQADVLWMVSDFDAGHKQVKSGKLFEYIGSAKPILGLVHNGSEAETLRKYEASYVADPDDIVSVKEAILDICQHWKAKKLKKGNEQFIQKFNRKKLSGKLARMFDSLTYH